MIVGSICVTGLAILMGVPVCHSYFGVSFPLLSEKVLRHLQIRY